MKKIAVVTGSRAEYGLLYWVIKEIQRSKCLELQVLVTGAHLEESSGYSYKNIEEDGIKINKTIPLDLCNYSPVNISKAIGNCIFGFSKAYEELEPDMIVILGDRYEVLAAACAAIPFNIPIAHIHGGESTEGAIDEQIRHAITKLSHLHFTATDRYRENVVRMGEEDWRVFNVGALGLESIRRIDYYSKTDLEQELGIDFSKPTFIATFHPVTLEYKNTELYINNLLTALKHKGLQVVFTGANIDTCGDIINARVMEAAKEDTNIKMFQNLGQRRYLSMLRYCDAMIGNSSSGIIEAASFNLPVINIGSRQDGRIKGRNVMDCGYGLEALEQCISLVLEGRFTKQVLMDLENPYGEGNSSKLIVRELEAEYSKEKLLKKKLAYD